MVGRGAEELIKEQHEVKKDDGQENFKQSSLRSYSIGPAPGCLVSVVSHPRSSEEMGLQID